MSIYGEYLSNICPGFWGVVLDSIGSQSAPWLPAILVSSNWPKYKLKDIAKEIRNGNELTAKQMLAPGSYPCIRNQDISKLDVKFRHCISKVDPKALAQPLRFIGQGWIVMTDMGTAKSLGRACAYLGEDNPIIGNSVIGIRHNQNPIFLAHVINSPFVREQIKRKMRGTIVQHLRVKDLHNLEIPLPDLETQAHVAEMALEMDWVMKKWGDVFNSYEELYHFTLRRSLWQ